jgi:hypothetical protein
MNAALLFLILSIFGLAIPLGMAQIYCSVADASDERNLLKSLAKVYSLPKGTTQQEALRVVDEEHARTVKAGS